MLRSLCALLVFMLASSVVAAQATKGDITFNPTNAGPVVFSHDYHTKARGVKCLACHTQTFAASTSGYQIKKEKLNKRDFCEHCHNGLKGFDHRLEKNCQRCHKK